jgi:hypothetical protein
VAFSLSAAWALALSFQKSGWAASRSISAMRDRLRSRSKMPPERCETFLEEADLFRGVEGHGGPGFSESGLQ